VLGETEKAKQALPARPFPTTRTLRRHSPPRRRRWSWS